MADNHVIWRWGCLTLGAVIKVGAMQEDLLVLTCMVECVFTLSQ